MGQLNVEIKARCNDGGDFAYQTLLDKCAEVKGVDHQTDVYFNVPNGRLKLRTGNIEHALVYYRRDNQTGPKESQVFLQHFKEPTDQLVELLKEAYGILTVVQKERTIMYIDNVKFHIDRVVGLGEFVEIEAIGKEGEEKKLENQCQAYRSILKIEPSDLIACSYSDLLIEQEQFKNCLVTLARRAGRSYITPEDVSEALVSQPPVRVRKDLLEVLGGQGGEGVYAEDASLCSFLAWKGVER